jgi:hypothetical protein
MFHVKHCDGPNRVALVAKRGPNRIIPMKKGAAIARNALFKVVNGGPGRGQDRV